MKKYIGIIFFYFFFWISVTAQQFIFTNYSVNEGLSQSVVNSMLQDSKGYIWIACQNGLNRFDGKSFEVINFNPLDSNSISNNWIYSLAEDSEGNIWVGNKGGLNKYVVTEKKFKRFNYKAPYPYNITQYTYDVICLRNGDIAINTPPVLTVYDPKINSFTHYQNKLPYDGSVKDVKIPVIEDNKGDLWIASTQGLSVLSLRTGTFRYIQFRNLKGYIQTNANITALYQDKTGQVWAGTTSGLYKFNTGINLFEETRFVQPHDGSFSFSNITIRCIIEDKKGNLIIGTEGMGLYVLTHNKDNSTIIQNYTTTNSEISHDIVQTLLIDKSENLWMGTLQGISKTDLKKRKFKLYRKSNTPNSVNLLGNVIASLYKDDEGILWIGNWGQGLNKLDRTTNTVQHFSTQQSGNHKIINDFIHVIFEDADHNIWLGTRDGIIMYDKPANRFIPYYTYFKNPALPAFKNFKIYMIIQDRHSDYWIGTQNGLYRINLKKPEVEIFKNELPADHHISSNLIYCLLEDTEGLIWIATLSGLDVYDPLSKKMKHFKKEENGLCDDFIITLNEDRYGRIWIGTSSYVNMYNKKDFSFTYYSQQQGLPNNRIFEIVKDKNKNLWFATGKGLCVFDEKSNSFHTYTVEDGLQGLEFNLRAACSCKDGEMLVGGMNGLNSFYPDSLFNNPYIPNLVFTSFYITKGVNKEFIPIENIPKIVLNYNVYSFTIEFAALEFTNPQKNQYAYKMEGISNDWVSIGNRSFVPFSALQPGEYTFKVKGSNNDGVWNSKEISLRIIILPPWWKSMYAYVSYMFILVILIVIFIKIRERKLRHDKKILEEKVSERTRQINEQNQLIISKNEELKELNGTKDKFFSIIGHDLRNPFNVIISLSDILLSGYKKFDADKVEYYLSNINNSSKHAHELLENLLTWARIQTQSIPFDPELFNMNVKIIETIDLLEVVSSKKNIRINIFAKEEVFIYADVNMFSTIFRNLLENAIKFTHPDGQVSIHINKKEDYCEITVEDNGVGISNEIIEKIFKVGSKHTTLGTNKEKGTGLGLILCKEFIEKHNGKIWVESIEGVGSKFIFTMPLANQV